MSGHLVRSQLLTQPSSNKGQHTHNQLKIRIKNSPSLQVRRKVHQQGRRHTIRNINKKMKKRKLSRNKSQTNLCRDLIQRGLAVPRRSKEGCLNSTKSRPISIREEVERTPSNSSRSFPSKLHWKMIQKEVSRTKFLKSKA